MAAVLELTHIDAFYGRIQALHGVSLHVEKGEIVALIGSNGAGKTTTLRVISGLLRPARGHVLYQGQDITRLSPDQIVQRRLIQSPEGRRIFARMTVLENLQLGAFTRRSATEVSETMEEVFSFFPRLKERVHQKGGTLSGGEQQMLAIGRALMSRPDVLLLDEPSLGLSPLLVQTIFGIIRDINKRGVTILLIEQNARQALQIAHRGYVLETGNITMQDTAANLLASEEVRAAYLGGGVKAS
ncbi:MAG TPA: ABC transporter ATP-binding protein [Candidatus Dormibacteraeota bacterium]|nr:ABC transporter ATP-binding protein [Candidatus Dormibacteraeota bacterium]